MAKRTTPRDKASRWAVAGESRGGVTRLRGASTKAEVIDRSRKLAKAQSLGRVVIHKSNGQIQTEHTYSNDPHPPKGVGRSNMGFSQEELARVWQKATFVR